MAVVIGGTSAWQYWRTPPILRDLEVGAGHVAGDMFDALHSSCEVGELPRLRANAREADQKIAGRLLTDLKGLTIPVDVMVEDVSGMRPNRLTVVRQLPQSLPRQHLVNLGNDLFVLSPEATLCMLGAQLGKFSLAKLMLEACGIFTLVPSNRRIDLVRDELATQGILIKENYRYRGIYGYSDAGGIPLGAFDRWGSEHEWTPSFSRRGRLTDLWKRYPLTCKERIEELLEVPGLVPGRSAARQAVKMVANGSGSPAEAKAYLLLCSGARNGGESWGNPDLNRRILFGEDARAVSHQSYCIADFLWADGQRVLEIQSEEYHSDELGYRLDFGRTAALESMGYAVAELLYEQMANLKQLDIVLPTLAGKLGIGLQRRTTAFLERREVLHRALFGTSYEP